MTGSKKPTSLQEQHRDLQDSLRRLRQQIHDTKAVKAAVRKEAKRYERARARAFAVWLKDKGYDWCSLCDRVQSPGSTQLLFVTIYSTTDQGYRCDPLEKQVHAACPACLAKKDTPSVCGYSGAPNVFRLFGKDFGADYPDLDFEYQRIERRDGKPWVPTPTLVPDGELDDQGYGKLKEIWEDGVGYFVPDDAVDCTAPRTVSAANAKLAGLPPSFDPRLK